ncbi:hypothetical protein INR75_06585 [Zunongwangia sp. SCSIO 43204]|uniref:hypothetical protein n=1 Tax=Zunongwangia sp. SCSIO 43204 TaxID=2779359 RepID=UPI001CA7D5AD|nr:hypothetical protein [Zunongwangia sp. SCSIO 43204]UAB85675.1 hypothetical protein INR75_06585 [Zunongwangia sp. SCSIO 43204]
MKTTIFKFILFFLAGVVLISFIGFIYMLFNDYTTGQRIGAIATTIIAGGGAYYILKQLRL